MKCVLLDDHQEERERYSRSLTDVGVECAVVTPASDILDSIKKMESLHPDLFLLDYEIKMLQDDGNTPTYVGLDVAAIVRRMHPETPIALLSRDDLNRTHALSSLWDVPGAFDELVYKDRLGNDAQEVGRVLQELVGGYQALAGLEARSQDALLESIGCESSEERKQVLQSNLPETHREADGQWRVSAIAHWIRKVLMRFPGVLLSSQQVAVHLGMSEESFRTPPVQAMFGNAKYSGPFAGESARWWRSRIFETVFVFFGENSMRIGDVSEFATGWNQVHRDDAVGPCLSYSGSGLQATVICHELQQAFARSETLPYRPDRRPHVMEGARVSFKAIQEEQYELDNVPPEYRDKAEEIEKAGGVR